MQLDLLREFSLADGRPEHPLSPPLGASYLTVNYLRFLALLKLTVNYL